MYDRNIICPTPRCVEYVEKYGDAYKRVTDTEFNKHPTCEGCGGKLIDGQWQHKCKKCGQDVEPGQLGGLFVPHLCPSCLDRARKTGARCPSCRKADIDCCC